MFISYRIALIEKNELIYYTLINYPVIMVDFVKGISVDRHLVKQVLCYIVVESQTKKLDFNSFTFILTWICFWVGG